MAKLLKLRRGTTTQHGSFTGAEGEVTIDTTKDTAVVHDGTQAGGRPLLREDMSNLPAGTIDNADINASAAIAGTKISPDFGSQDITTTGKIKFANVYSNESDLPSASTYHGMFAHVHSTGLAYYAHGGNWIKLAPLNAPDFTGGIDVTGGITTTGTIEAGNHIQITNATPSIYLTDSNDNPDYVLRNNGGQFIIRDDTSGATRLAVNTDGHLDIAGNTDFGAGIDVTGNITATGTVDGRDVASDGSKLDGIESGATADQSASEILTLIKTVDGSGSGLAADVVDGMHASEFLAAAGDTATGDITFSGGAGAVTVAADSDIRGTSGNWTGEAPTSGGKLQWHSNNLYIQTYTSNIFRNSSGTNTFVVDSSGNATATGNVTAYSDARLKTNINTINDALSIVGKLRGVSFDWKESGKHSIGVIAQEVEKVIPEVVLTSDNLDPATGETTEVKSVDYGKIVGVLINAINELKAEVDELKGGK